MDQVIKFKLCEKVECGHCVNGYKIKTTMPDKDEKDGFKRIYGCKLVDSIALIGPNIGKLADTIDRLSKMKVEDIVRIAKTVKDAVGDKHEKGEAEKE